LEDNKIIELFFQRDEESILAAEEKYGHYLDSISFNVLKNVDDAKECTNDALLRAWNSIPPQKPDSLKAYLGKIARNLALDLYSKQNAQKRGSGQVEIALDELSECLNGSESQNPEANVLGSELSIAINEFLKGLDSKKRIMFMRRYFYLDSIGTIARDMLVSQSNVKTTLWRIRAELHAYLKKENLID